MRILLLYIPVLVAVVLPFLFRRAYGVRVLSAVHASWPGVAEVWVVDLADSRDAVFTLFNSLENDKL